MPKATPQKRPVMPVTPLTNQAAMRSRMKAPAKKAPMPKRMLRKMQRRGR